MLLVSLEEDVTVDEDAEVSMDEEEGVTGAGDDVLEETLTTVIVVVEVEVELTNEIVGRKVEVAKVVGSKDEVVKS